MLCAAERERAAGAAENKFLISEASEVESEECPCSPIPLSDPGTLLTRLVNMLGDDDDDWTMLAGAGGLDAATEARDERTIMDTMVAAEAAASVRPGRRSGTVVGGSAGAGAGAGAVASDASLLREMRAALEESVSSSTPASRSAPAAAAAGRVARRGTTPMEHAVLACVAEDEELSVSFATSRRSEPAGGGVGGGSGGGRVSRALAVAAARHVKSKLASALREIGRAQIVSLAFLVDTTSSMHGHIAGVRKQVERIVDEIGATGCKVAGVAFVGYKDHCDGRDHFEVRSFTRDLNAFRTFVRGVGASGGGDFPEDVLGGLRRAVDLAWPEEGGTR